MKYIVHRYYQVHDRVEVEADNQERACRKADELDRNMDEVEDDEGRTASFLVDEEGDEEYEQSCWYSYSKDGKLVVDNP